MAYMYLWIHYYIYIYSTRLNVREFYMDIHHTFAERYLLARDGKLLCPECGNKIEVSFVQSSSDHNRCIICEDTIKDNDGECS